MNDEEKKGIDEKQGIENFNKNLRNLRIDRDKQEQELDDLENDSDFNSGQDED